MGQKRNYDEVNSPELNSPEPQTSNDTFKKQKRINKSKHRPSEGSSQWAKKRVRNIERLLNRDQDLPANVRNDLERELAAHKTSVNDKAFQKKRSTMISKYHMVRFFERKKAMRLAKQVRKKLQQSESPEEKEELERQLHIAEVDESYTQNFPHAETYISLYKVETAKDDDVEDRDAKMKTLLEAERPPMWTTIEKAMEEGPSALRAIRERRTPDKSKSGSQRERQQPSKSKPKPVEAQAKPKPQATATPPTQGEAGAKMNRRERRRLMREAAPAKQEDDDDSDGGGFFEED